MMDADQWLAFERCHLWHPYAAMPATPAPYPVVATDGVFLTLADGRRLIDGMSSWWAAIHGYNHPRLNAAAHQQIDTMAHVMFGGLTHPPAVELVQRLLTVVPGNLDKVFLCDSGSVSVEVALKMAVQFWQARGQHDKNRFIALHGGYHGDTFGAMSVCDPVNGMHHLFNGMLASQYFLPRPRSRYHESWDAADLSAAERMLDENHQSVAAVILEPIVQGAGGMWFYHAEYLRQIRRLCDRYGVLLIADEIATGFGRTGRFWGCEHAGIVPDILCMGKALTGGYLSLAATLTHAEVAETISSGTGCFMHGPTFMANPLACGIASASLDVLLESPWRDRVAAIEKSLAAGLDACRDLTQVEDVRVLGAIGVVQTREPLPLRQLQEALIRQGVWLRPFGRLLYTMPPYIVTDEQLACVTSAMYQALADLPQVSENVR